MRRVAIRWGLVAGLALALADAATALYQFSSADGGYAIAFPIAPKEQLDNKGGMRSVMNTLTHDNAFYGIIHVDYEADFKPNDELESNVNNYLREISATATLRRKTKFTRGPGDKLSAEEFSYENDKVTGKGIVVVDGRRAYMAAAFGIKPHDRRAKVDQFLKSLKLSAKPKADTKPTPAKAAPESAAAPK